MEAKSGDGCRRRRLIGFVVTRKENDGDQARAHARRTAPIVQGYVFHCFAGLPRRHTN